MSTHGKRKLAATDVAEFQAGRSEGEGSAANDSSEALDTGTESTICDDDVLMSVDVAELERAAQAAAKARRDKAAPANTAAELYEKVRTTQACKTLDEGIEAANRIYHKTDICSGRPNAKPTTRGMNADLVCDISIKSYKLYGGPGHEVVQVDSIEFSNGGEGDDLRLAHTLVGRPIVLASDAVFGKIHTNNNTPPDVRNLVRMFIAEDTDDIESFKIVMNTLSDSILQQIALQYIAYQVDADRYGLVQPHRLRHAFGSCKGADLSKSVDAATVVSHLGDLAAIVSPVAAALKVALDAMHTQLKEARNIITITKNQGFPAAGEADVKAREDAWPALVHTFYDDYAAFAAFGECRDETTTDRVRTSIGKRTHPSLRDNSTGLLHVVKDEKKVATGALSLSYKHIPFFRPQQRIRGPTTAADSKRVKTIERFKERMRDEHIAIIEKDDARKVDLFSFAEHSYPRAVLEKFVAAPTDSAEFAGIVEELQTAKLQYSREFALMLRAGSSMIAYSKPHVQLNNRMGKLIHMYNEIVGYTVTHFGTGRDGYQVAVGAPAVSTIGIDDL